jgi:TolB-like protein
MTRDGFSFGSFRFDPAEELLLRDGEPVPLGRRAGRLLGTLLRRRGEIVPRSALIDAAWPAEAVEESNLSVQIAHLRKRIGARWIRTIERVGYQFVSDAALSSRETTIPAAPPVGAVRAFPDLAGSGAGRLGALLAEEIITALSRFRSLSVTARTSSFRFAGRAVDIRAVAAALSARYVVEGSVRRHGGRSRLSLQLIDGVSGAHLWADNLDSESSGAFESTDELAGRAAAMVEAQVHLAEIARSARERPESLEAYDLYLRARRHIRTSSEEGNAAAYPLLVRALERDPDNIAILAAFAEIIHHRRAVGWRDHDGMSSGIVLDIVRRGLEHPGLDAPALGLFADALHTAGEEDLGAVAAERAVAMNPNSALALVCAGLIRAWGGNPDGAAALFTRAIALTPGEPTQRFAYQGMATVSRLRGESGAMTRYARLALAVSPAISSGHWHLIAAAIHHGRRDEARRCYDRYRRIAPGVTIASLRRGQVYRDPASLDVLVEGLRAAGMPER